MPEGNRIFITEVGLQSLEKVTGKPTRAERLLYQLRNHPEGTTRHGLGNKIYWRRGEKRGTIEELIGKGLIEYG